MERKRRKDRGHTLSRTEYKKSKTYSDRCATTIRLIYIVAIVLWIALVIVLNIYHVSWLGLLILAIPIAIFLFAAVTVTSLSREVEDEVINANYLSIGLIILLPLLVWVSKDFTGNKQEMAVVIIVAIILLLFSMLDIWVRRKWLSVVKHIRSICQTTSLVLLIFALYLYFTNRADGPLSS